MNFNRHSERVLILASRWDYGDAARGDSFEYEYFFSAMRNVADEVHFLDCNELKGLDADHQYREIADTLERLSVSLVFSVLFRDEVHFSVLGRLRDSGQTPVVNWFCDDHWRYESFSRQIAPFLSLAVTTDVHAATKYRSDGFPVLESQWGVPFDRVSSLSVAAETNPCVAFVGQVYGRRGAALETISRRLGPETLSLHGFGTPNGRVTVEAMYRLFNHSAVSLNFADSWNGRVRELIGYAWPAVRRPRQLKARTFEVPGAGGVLVTHPTPFLGKYFEVGTEVLTAESANEFADVCAAVLADPDMRARVAAAGRARTIEDHTVESRLDSVFKALRA